MTRAELRAGKTFVFESDSSSMFVSYTKDNKYLLLFNCSPILRCSAYRTLEKKVKLVCNRHSLVEQPQEGPGVKFPAIRIDNATPSHIGPLIKQLRITRKLTQTELGDLVGADKFSVSKWEKEDSNMHLGTFFKLLDALGATVSLEIFTEK